MKYSMSEKGQALMVDFAAGFLLFILAWVFLTANFQNTFVDLVSKSERNEMQLNATNIAEQLLSSKGYPENWNELPINDVNSIGLIINDREISEEKLLAFSNIADYESLKEKVGLFRYDIYFEFQGVDSATAGLEPIGKATKIVMERVATYKGEQANAKITIYKLE